MRVWDTLLCQCVLTLGGHLQSVTCVKWGGTDLIYSSSQDRTVKVWRGSDVCIIVYRQSKAKGRCFAVILRSPVCCSPTQLYYTFAH